MILASQTSLGAGLSTIERQIEGAVMAVYALFAFGFLPQAIDALRPKHYRPVSTMVARSPRHPRGVRYFEDVVVRDTDRMAGAGATSRCSS